MDNKKRIHWITRTAISMALLILFQATTQSMGQYVTGSLVNLMLILPTALFGVLSGGTVAILSPLFAFLVGVGPALPQVVPFIMLGNLSIVLVWWLALKHLKNNDVLARGVALVAGAVVKFMVLYLSIVKLAIPFILNVNEKQAAMLSASFSVPQLVTASIGGALAFILIPLLKNALRLKD